MQRILCLVLSLCALTLSSCLAVKLTLLPTNSYWVTIEGAKDTRFNIGDNVDLFGVFIPAGEHGDVMAFSELPDERLAVRHFYLNDSGPLAPTTYRRPVHMRGIITGNSHYGYGYEVSILSLEEIALTDVLTIPVKAAIRRAAEDSAYDVSQINLSDISLPQELSYNSGFRIATDRFKGSDLEFSFWDETGNLIAQVDRTLRLPPLDDPRLNRFLEVYYIYNRKEAQVTRIVVTAHGEFLE